MRKLFFFALLSAITCLHTVEGADNISKSCGGYQKYEGKSLDSIQGNGTVILNGTKVSGLVQVNGNLKAEGSAIHRLQVNGHTDLRNCVITDTTILNGSVIAENTKFQNGLVAASKVVVLKLCTVGSLTLPKLDGYTGKQIIDLRISTDVTGPIVVESGNGEVWVSPNSEISEVQVLGAQIYRK